MSPGEPRPIRVAMICSQVPPVYGGAGGQALRLAQELAHQHCDIDLLTQNQLHAPRVEYRSGVRILRAPGESVMARLPRRIAQVARTVAFMLLITRQLLRQRYDVIHLHGCYWFGLPASLIATVRRTSIVTKVTRLGEDDAMTVRMKRWHGIPVGRLYSRPLRMADTVIVLNRECADRHQTWIGKDNVRILPNGVDVHSFQSALRHRTQARATMGISAETTAVLFVGYLAPHKGVIELLEAWSALEESGSRHLLLVGPSSGFYRELTGGVDEMANRLRSVTLSGHQPSTEMPKIYAAADIFILPTRAEGMPNSLLEALAAGLTCIAAKVPGVIEIADRTPGLVLMDEISATVIARTINSVDNSLDPSARGSTIPAEFRIDSVAGQYLEIYRKAAAKRMPRDTIA